MALRMGGLQADGCPTGDPQATMACKPGEQKGKVPGPFCLGVLAEDP